MKHTRKNVRFLGCGTLISVFCIGRTKKRTERASLHARMPHSLPPVWRHAVEHMISALDSGSSGRPDSSPPRIAALCS